MKYMIKYKLYGNEFRAHSFWTSISYDNVLRFDSYVEAVDHVLNMRYDEFVTKRIRIVPE